MHTATGHFPKRPFRRGASARLRPHTFLQNQVGLATASDRAQLAALREAASHRYDGTRDLVGMRKQIVVATGGGGLFALHSGDGRVLWRAHLGGVRGLALAALAVAKAPHRQEEDHEVRSWLSSALQSDKGKR